MTKTQPETSRVPVTTVNARLLRDLPPVPDAERRIEGGSTAKLNQAVCNGTHFKEAVIT